MALKRAYNHYSQFNSTTHPYWLPNFMDAFTWSLPFVASKILEMLLGVLAVCSEEELEASDEDLPGPMDASIPPHEKAARRQEIKNKIMAVGKMQRLYALLRYVDSLYPLPALLTAYSGIQ